MILIAPAPTTYLARRNHALSSLLFTVLSCVRTTLEHGRAVQCHYVSTVSAVDVLSKNPTDLKLIFKQCPSSDGQQ